MAQVSLGFEVVHPFFCECVDTTRLPEVIADGCKWTEGPVWLDDGLYFNDIPNQRMMRWSEQGGCFVFGLSPDGDLRVVAYDFDTPNGLAFSPDESQLCIADSGAIRSASFPGIDDTLPHLIRVFDGEDGQHSNDRHFVEITPGVPDGVRVDHEGYVWTSALDGFHCYAQDGNLIGKICLQSPTSNLCFGGTEGTTHFTISSDKVYGVQSTRCDAAHVIRNRKGK